MPNLLANSIPFNPLFLYIFLSSLPVIFSKLLINTSFEVLFCSFLCSMFVKDLRNSTKLKHKSIIKDTKTNVNQQKLIKWS